MRRYTKTARRRAYKKAITIHIGLARPQAARPDERQAHHMLEKFGCGHRPVVVEREGPKWTVLRNPYDNARLRLPTKCWQHVKTVPEPRPTGRAMFR